MYYCNPCVGHSPRTKIFLFLLSICTDDLISAIKVITSICKKNSERESNSMR